MVKRGMDFAARRGEVWFSQVWSRKAWQGRGFMEIKKEEIMGAVIELKRSAVDSNFVEKVAYFAHEGLPYMKDGDNWVDFDKTWVVNIWWDHTEQTYRATMYKKESEGRHVDLRSGVDLF